MTREEIKQIAARYAAKYGLPSDFVNAVIQIESNYNPNAYRAESGGRYSMGLMQVLRGGGAVDEFEKVHGMKSDDWYYDVENNIKAGTWFLGSKIIDQLNHFNQPVTVRNIIIAYNAGIGNLIKGNDPSYTRVYLDKIQKAGFDIGTNPVKSGAFFFDCPCCGNRIQVSKVDQ